MNTRALLATVLTVFETPVLAFDAAIDGTAAIQPPANGAEACVEPGFR